MERHPLIFLAIVVTLGVLQGTVVGLLIRTQHTVEQLIEVTRGVMSNLADLVESQYEPPHRDRD